MRFLVIGPGAMGLLFAARLKRFANQDVAILDYKKERAEYLNKTGIKVDGIMGKFHCHVPVIMREQISSPPDVIMLFVKAYNTRDAAYAIKDIIGDDTTVITLQNGIGNIEILQEVLGKEVFGGVTAEGATLLDIGYVRHAGHGDTIIGPTDKKVLDVAQILNNAGFHTEVKDDIEGVVWGKLLINVAINPITAITGLRNGMLAELNATMELMKRCLDEAMRIVKARGIRLPYDDPVDMAIMVCKRTAENISSMLQDVLSEKQTEIDFLNGAIVKEGEQLNIPTPVNKTLTQLIHAIQSTYPNRITKK